MKKQNLRVCALALAAAFCATLSAFGADRKSADYHEVYNGELTTMNYLVTSQENEHWMFANLLDGLVEYDKYGVVKPALAESWKTSADGLVWTFTIRKGVKWYTSSKKEYAEVTAQDWVSSAKYLLTGANASQTADVFYSVVKNAEGYFKGTVTDFAAVGVKAKDAYTLEYTLDHPVPYFLSMLSYVCFLPLNEKFLAESGAKFGTDNKYILYNGAYIMENFEPQVSRELIRNEKYWDRANVFIKRLIYKYNKESGTLGPELYLRGENDKAVVPSSMVDSWLKDPAKKDKVQPAVTNSYSYFYAFNFDPKFAAEYQPENWKAAVNDEAFRKAVFHALDRKAAVITAEPYDPARRLTNTITPAYFVTIGGKDFTQLPPLAAISGADSFNKDKALKFKAQAMKELAGKATFPVKILMPYRGDMPEWANRAQVVEQQLEGLLGKDFIDVVPQSFPATGFLGATRKAGNYALQEVNWGPDYADPETYTDPFAPGSNYNKPELAAGYPGKDGKTVYENLLAAAKAETLDLKKRYDLFAKAEAFLIDKAFVIPYALGGGGYQACRLEPFASPFAPFGLSVLKFKGQIVLEKPLNIDAYKKAEAEWKKARDAAVAKTK